MEKPEALIVWGGWENHEPGPIGEVLGQALEQSGFIVHREHSLDAFCDVDRMSRVRLIVPIWSMGQIERHQLEPVLQAVATGAGVAGLHGGMCDAFRDSVEWQFMTGGSWVAHPGGKDVEYTVAMRKGVAPLLEDIDDFTVCTEQYYMHVDPAVTVLATTRFPTVDGPHVPNGPVDMPVIWTKRWGQGRVFYCSLGHSAHLVQQQPILEIMSRGMAWAAGVEKVQ